MDEKKTMDGSKPGNAPFGLSSEELRQMIKATVMKMGPEVSKEEKQAQAKILVKVFEQGMAPKDALNFSKEDIVQIYSYAYSLFTGGKYKESSELFKMLLMLDPKQVDFATALGVCYHRLKNYKFAIKAYMLSSLLDPENPVPIFYAYDCCKNINDLVSAGMMLCKVIKVAEKREKYAKLKEKAEALLESLEKEIVALKK